MNRYTIEHWRDGELIEKFTLTNKIIVRGLDGTAVVSIPPGLIELATNDELHFDCDGLIELCQPNTNEP